MYVYHCIIMIFPTNSYTFNDTNENQDQQQLSNTGPDMDTDMDDS